MEYCREIPFGRATFRFAPGRSAAAYGFLASFHNLGEAMPMLFRDGEYTCAHCGESLEIPAGADPQLMIRAASGKRNVRVLTFMGVEIHRCDVVGLNRRLPDRSGMQRIAKTTSLASRGGLSES